MNSKIFQCHSVYSVVNNLCPFVSIRGSIPAQNGVVSDNFGVLL